MGNPEDNTPTGSTESKLPPVHSDAHPFGEKPGDWIGPYKLMEVIGEGGFGTVWVAERREPMVQRVALKVIKPGMDSKAVIARFDQERQALAVMDHPNVAKVFDGGVTPLGRPYFVMEHVQGEAITTFCDRQQYSIRQRLELFTHVCEAVQHAHHKGIIHRDIKPSNVLVAIKDGQAIPKVIDFGVAKAISHTLTDHTIFTESGQLIGTPEYMSPEQAEMGATDIDTRTDVYSLGVVLYELVSGMLPFDPKTLRAVGYEAIRKVLREQDAPKPSTRLSTADDVTGEGIAKHRVIAREQLAKELRRELDWIPLKAIRKDRRSRYTSPLELAVEIGRYLDGEALHAGPQSSWYYFSKFTKRHRGAMAAAVLVSVSIISLGLGGIWAVQQGRAREAAEVLAETKAKNAIQAEQRERTQSYARRILSAQRAINAHDQGRAVAELEACPEGERAWEWNVLRAQADNTVWSHSVSEHEIQDVGFVSDHGHVSIQLAPDDPDAAGQSEKGAIETWNMVTDMPDAHPQSLLRRMRSINGAAILAPSHLRITCWANGSSWTREIGSEFNCGIYCKAIDPEHFRVIADNGWIRDTRLFSIAPEFACGKFDAISGYESKCVVSDDGSRFVSRSIEGHPQLWDTSASAPRLIWSGSGETVKQVWLSGDGEHVALRGSYGLRIVDAASWEHFQEVQGFEQGEKLLAIDRRGMHVCLYSPKNGLRVASTKPGSTPALLKVRDLDIEQAGFVPDSTMLCVAGTSLEGWDYEQHRRVWDRVGACRSLWIAGDGTEALVLSSNRVEHFDPHNGGLLASREFETPPYAAAGKRDRLMVAQNSHDYYVGVTQADASMSPTLCEGRTVATVPSPTGTHSFVVDRDGTRGRLFDLRNQHVLREWPTRIDVPFVYESNSVEREFRLKGEATPIHYVGPLSKAAFSADGRWFVLVDPKSSGLSLIDLADYSEKSVPLDRMDVTAIACSANADHIAIGYASGGIESRSSQTGQLEQAWRAPRGTASLLLFRLGAGLLCYCSDQSLWLLGNGAAEASELTGYDPDSVEFLQTLQMSADGRLALVWSGDEENAGMAVWDLDEAVTDRRVSSDLGRSGIVAPGEIAPDGSTIVYRRMDLSMVIQRTSDLRVLAEIPDSPDTHPIISPDSALVALAGDEFGTILDLRTGAPTTRLSWDHVPIATLGWNADSTRIATVSKWASQIAIYDAVKGSRLSTIHLRAGSIEDSESSSNRRLTWAPRGNLIAATSSTGAHLVDAETGQELDLGPLGAPTRGQFAFMPDGNSLITFDAIWDVRSGRQIVSLPKREGGSPGDQVRISLSPNYKFLWRGVMPADQEQYDADIVDLSTNTTVARYKGPHRPVLWSSDGKRAFEDEGLALVWDPMSGQDLFSLPDPANGSVVARRLVSPSDTLMILTNQYVLRTVSPISARQQFLGRFGAMKSAEHR